MNAWSLLPVFFAALFVAASAGMLSIASLQTVNRANDELSFQQAAPIAVSNLQAFVAQTIATNRDVDAVPIPAPVTKVPMCNSGGNTTCGTYVTITYAAATGTGSGADETASQLQRAPTTFGCAAAQGHLSEIVTLQLTDVNANVLATRNLTVSERTLCSTPYYEQVSVSDDSGRALNVDGSYRSAGDYGGCDPANPTTCETGLATGADATDTRLHAFITCAGEFCTALNTPQPVDNFEDVQQTNAAVNGAASR
jgi:hypothetical protein